MLQLSHRSRGWRVIPRALIRAVGAILYISAVYEYVGAAYKHLSVASTMGMGLAIGSACLVSTVACPMSASAAPIAGEEIGTAGFVGVAAQGPFDTPTLVTSYGEFVSAFGSSTLGLSNPWLAPSVAGFFTNGGHDLYVVRVSADDDASLIGDDLGPGSRTGLQALLEVDAISVVAIPGSSSQVVQAAMIAHCENAGDRMALLDPSVSANVEVVLAQRAGLGSDKGYAALYFPWVEAAPAGELLMLPPSGFVAGHYASNDPPDSPVGILATATDVSHSITNAEQDLLTPAGVNAIRFFSGQGVRIWGARTIASDPEWIYVSVRRTALYLEESITRSTQWLVFEPNEAALWATLRSDVENFLHDLWVDNWFQGATPGDAYFVRCGLGTTMTQTDIDEGRTIILFAFAPIRPAEFVVIEVAHQRSSLTSAAEDLVDRSRVVLHPATPNPFNPSTVIRFELEATARIGLKVYDLAGRLVRVLEEGREFAPGEHRIFWDGKDDASRTLASGRYVIRLSGTDSTRSQRVTLLK